MTKTIVTRTFNSASVNILNIVGGNVPMNASTSAAAAGTQISTLDLNALYYEFVDPFVEQGPFSMGAIVDLNDIYTRIYTLIMSSTANQNNLTLLILEDIMTILVQARDIYFDNLKFQREIQILRVKYQNSQTKILDLTQELLNLEAALPNAPKNLALTGSLGIKINQPKNLIYAQAVLNINLAWYYYLHMKRVIDPRLYMATVQYIKTMGANAYDNLIVLLDERYKEE
jgi:hypothetical protein